MPREIYKIRWAIILPLTLAVFTLGLLLLLSLFSPSLPGEGYILAAAFFIMFSLLLDVFSRSLSLKAESVEIGTFLRKKEIAWDDITYVGSVIMGKKVYLLLTTRKGFYILSNNYAKFPKLLDRIRERLDEERVEEEVIRLIEQPLRNDRPVFSAWLLLMAIATAIIFRLYWTLSITIG